MLTRLVVSFVALASAVGAASLFVAAEQPQGRDEHFTSSEQCAICHTTGAGAEAMWTAAGEDISPYWTWQGSLMANSFRDPYFRAQLRKETEAAGEAVQDLCLRCHTPMLHHEARLGGAELPRLADVEGDPFADDGVSCTVCHLIAADGLGEERTFSGLPDFDDERRIFGPFEQPFVRPMQRLVGYTPTQADHVRSAAMCGSCHTLYTEHEGHPFPEQTPYLEWRNSEFSDENGRTRTSRTCQQCHMRERGAVRIARNPMGRDFPPISPRAGYRDHAIVGGNAFVIDMLRVNAEELDVLAEPEALVAMADAARRQLAEATARLTVSEIVSDGGEARFSVRVENLTGHKFPTAYPSRRAWLHVTVSAGDRVLFETGAVDAAGRLVGVQDPFGLPHVQTVRTPADIVVYELVAAAPDGEPTTFLTKMAQRKKDNRLLPRGWDPDGPHVDDTGAVGVDGDADFGGGGDFVHFEVPLPAAARAGLRVDAELLYQPIPPAWVDAIRAVDAAETNRFVRFYEAADKTPDRVATAVRQQD